MNFVDLCLYFCFTICIRKMNCVCSLFCSCLSWLSPLFLTATSFRVCADLLVYNYKTPQLAAHQLTQCLQLWLLPVTISEIVRFCLQGGLQGFLFNPLKPSTTMWLHFECSAPYRLNLPFLIYDIQVLWRSGLSARVPECQKLKMVG